MATPTDITGLVHRFRASLLTGLTNGAAVASAAFESGGLTLTQGTASAQPTYVSSSVNGVAGLRFNGTSSTMLASVGTNIGLPYTLVFVVNLTNPTATRQDIFLGGPEIVLNDVSANTYAMWGGSAEIYGGTPTAGGHVIVFTMDPTSGVGTLYVDGTQVASGVPGSQPFKSFYLGSSSGSGRFFYGDINEMIVYNRLLNATERATLGRYMKDTYAINVSDAAATTVSNSRFVRSGDLVSIVMANVKAPASSTQTANYTLGLKDIGKVIEMNVTAVNTVTVPPNASVAFPIGALITVYQVGIGQTNIVAGAGVTFDSPNGTALYSRYSTVQLRQRATNEWVITGSATNFYDPTAIGGLVYRLRASMIGQTVDGTPVASATPEVGTTVLSQPTAASRPKWYSAGKNGKPYLSFDGVDDYLFNSTSVGYSQPFTIAVAAQVYGFDGAREIVKLGGLEMIANTATSLGPRWGLYSGSSVDSTYQAGGVTSFVAMYGMGGAGNGRAYTNGVLTASASTGNNVTNGDFYVGTHTSIARFLYGDIYEILMYNSALSTTDLLSISAYFRAFYQ